MTPSVDDLHERRLVTGLQPLDQPQVGSSACGSGLGGLAHGAPSVTPERCQGQTIMLELRVARHTERLDEVIAFYRDGIGLTEVGRFHDHDSYDGVFLALPGTGAHLEFTAGGAHAAPAPHPESLLVLYLGDPASVEAVVARLGIDPIPPANPYWAEHGLTFPDPDGFRVVLVPERWNAS